MNPERRQVVVVGAGPAGSIAAALLQRRGRDVLVLERQRFPRFCIGESLLVHCLDFVAEAGMIEAVDAAGMQLKTGASFVHGGRYSEFDFADRFNAGRPHTYHVERAGFDKLLADAAAAAGADIRYGHEIVAAQCDAGGARLTVRSGEGLAAVQADYVLDASGFGRTLPRLLDLERPSSFPARSAIFTHLADGIGGGFDRTKTRITVHPHHRDVWFWLIPFPQGRSSLGVVAAADLLASRPGTPAQKLRQLAGEDPGLAQLLHAAHWDTPVRELAGFAANVVSMCGPGFALLGNAAEFLDPIFSSGVTIAMRSASMAAAALDRELAGAAVDWQREYETPLRRGVDCFRAYVEAWYDGRFQDIVFHPRPTAAIRRMICSILAGYAWDESNPYVAAPRRRLGALAHWCAA
ncbi:MAG TPA: NAD(P)/FAD-dependent oxidoreductase [Steroidobacteraceae bacterium]|nr:NAD(P)/FAD-dependent oxidoreductase [Steroidobacteraceae bacterium]